MKKLKPAVVLGAIAAIFLAVYLYVRWKQKKQPVAAGTTPATQPATSTTGKSLVFGGGALGPIAASVN